MLCGHPGSSAFFPATVKFQASSPEHACGASATIVMWLPWLVSLTNAPASTSTRWVYTPSFLSLGPILVFHMGQLTQAKLLLHPGRVGPLTNIFFPGCIDRHFWYSNSSCHHFKLYGACTCFPLVPLPNQVPVGSERTFLLSNDVTSLCMLTSRLSPVAILLGAHDLSPNYWCRSLFVHHQSSGLG